jgi:hypothetical protein
MRTSSSLFPLAALLALSGCPFESSADKPAAAEPDGGASTPSDSGGAGGSREIPWDWDRDGGLGGSGGGSGGEGGNSGPADARPLPPATPPISNTPNAEFVYLTGASSGLRLKSARLTLETIASTFQEWLAEAVNDSSEVMCLAKVTAEYKDSSGATLAKTLAYVDGPPYQGFGTVSSSCLAPGEHGALWDLQQVPRAFSLSLVRRVEVNVDLLPTPDRKPHPSAPVVTPGLVSDKFGSGTYWTLRGTLRAVATIHNYGVHVYPIGGDGMVLASLTASMPGALLSAGSSWSFETSGAKQRFSTQMIFAGFIDGPPRMPAVPRDGVELVFEERELERRMSWARSREVAAARELALGR